MRPSDFKYIRRPHMLYIAIAAQARDGRGGMGKKRSPGGSVDSSGLSG